MADGHLHQCKVCVSARVRENRRERLEQYAQYEWSRANLPHRVEARRKYEEEHKEQIAEYNSDDISNIQPLCGSCNRKKFVNIIDYRLSTDVLSYSY